MITRLLCITWRICICICWMLVSCRWVWHWLEYNWVCL